MTSVLFLHGASDRLLAASVWLGRHAARGEGIAVFIPDPKQAALLDCLLWEQPPTGFVPHCHHDSPLAAETPVVICTETPEVWPRSNLLNLSEQIPDREASLDHLIEIVSQEHAVRVAGRERFRAYREAGYAVDAREIDPNPAR